MRTTSFSGIILANTMPMFIEIIFTKIMLLEAVVVFYSDPIALAGSIVCVCVCVYVQYKSHQQLQ